MRSCRGNPSRAGRRWWWWWWWSEVWARSGIGGRVGWGRLGGFWTGTAECRQREEEERRPRSVLGRKCRTERAGGSGWRQVGGGGGGGGGDKQPLAGLTYGLAAVSAAAAGRKLERVCSSSTTTAGCCFRPPDWLSSPAAVQHALRDCGTAGLRGCRRTRRTRESDVGEPSWLGKQWAES